MEFLVPKFVSFFTCPPCPSYAAMDEVFICKYKIIPCKSVCETTNNQPALLILIRLVLQQMRNAALDDVDCAVQIDPKCCIGQWTPICNFFLKFIHLYDFVDSLLWHEILPVREKGRL